MSASETIPFAESDTDSLPMHGEGRGGVDGQGLNGDLAVADQSGFVLSELFAAKSAVEQFLDAIHAEPEQTKRAELATTAKQWLDYQDTLILQAQSLNIATVEVAKNIQSQRDAALEELATLIEAIETVDFDNPDIARLAEVVEEGIIDELQWQYEDELAEALVEERAEATREGQEIGIEYAYDNIAQETAVTLCIDVMEAHGLLAALRGEDDHQLDVVTIDKAIAYLTGLLEENES